MLLCVAAGAWVGLAADEISHVMRVTLTDGSVDTYIVADGLSVELDEEFVHVSTREVYFKYEVGQVGNYTFEDIATGVEEVLEEGSEEGVTFQYVDGKTVVIRGISSDSAVQVYSLSGQKQQVEMTKYENGADVSLQSLPAGTYIVSIKNGKSIKVIKR